MKFKVLLAALAITSTLAVTAQAQVLGNITASPVAAKVSEPVTITATIDVLNANYCGYAVGFGDGTTKDGVSDVSNASPLVVTHSYAKAGTYHVTLGGRNVQNHPNCGGGEKAVDVTVVDSGKPAAKPVAMTAASVCSAGWKLSGKLNAKTGAFTCAAKAGTALPAAKAECKGDLTYFENAKKGQYGCKP
jgi:hypothetical protein